MSVIVEADKRQVPDVTLTAQERDELRLALETYVNDLHMEIAHTDRYEFRQELKARRVLLHGVLQRLGGRPPAVAGWGRQGGPSALTALSRVRSPF